MLDSAYSRSYPDIYRGIVESNEDPDNLGRCKIRVPSIHGALNYPIEALPWARPIVLSPVGKNRGSVNIPEKGDIVWVFFEGAVREFPVYFGGTYAKEDLDISTERVDFYIEDNNKVSYDRKNKVYTIAIGANSVEISPTGIKLLGNTSVTGNLNVSGDLSVGGTATVGNLIIRGSCNKEVD